MHAYQASEDAGSRCKDEVDDEQNVQRSPEDILAPLQRDALVK